MMYIILCIIIQYANLLDYHYLYLQLPNNIIYLNHLLKKKVLTVLYYNYNEYLYVLHQKNYNYNYKES